MRERSLRRLSKFDEYLTEGRTARLFGISTEAMDRDELIAAFGFMVKFQQKHGCPTARVTAIQNERDSRQMRVTLNEESQSEWQAKNLEYLRYEYDLKPDDVVIDIGAYRGEWAEQIFCRYGCKLIVIEPGPWIVGFPHGEVINKAAGIKDGTQKFGGAYYYTSAFEEGNQEYETFDINSLLSKHEEIALVKINVEGSEYELLDHIIDAGLHTRIKDLQVQFHCIEYEPWQSWYSGIEGRLKKTHSPSWRYPFVWESWKRKTE